MTEEDNKILHYLIESIPPYYKQECAIEKTFLWGSLDLDHDFFH